MGLADEKYMLFTTYRRDGTPVATPTWVVSLEGGTFGFWTASDTGKAKRLKHDAHVTVQPSNAHGKVKEGTTPTEGTAVLVESGPQFDEIQSRVKAKYGLMSNVTRFLRRIGALVKRKPFVYGDRGVVITLEPPA